MKKVLAICGSTRKNSSNLTLLHIIAGKYKKELDFHIYQNLEQIPAFNPDEEDREPEAVIYFKKKISESDGVLICTPEYAHGVPGSLKNAIDWTVGSAEFWHKPTALITASTEGQFAHEALLETLRVIEALNVDKHQLCISLVKMKIKEAEIVDENTKTNISNLMQRFMESLDVNENLVKTNEP